MIEEVFETIDKENLIAKGDNIVLGLSGGPDSMALLYLLLEYRKKVEFDLYIAHVNHGVRGKEARRDQNFVEKVAKEHNLKFFTKNIDMIQSGKDMGISPEEAGRILRYDFFRSIVKGKKGAKVAVAHNKNDQAETLIMRFLRGTGIDGLKGMDYKVDDIIRPILGIDRELIEKYIKDNEISTVLDSTNDMTIYTRNKVRLELIPYIKDNFNPNLIDTLWRMSKISKEDSSFLEKYTDNRYNDIVKKEEDNKVIFFKEAFNREDMAIKSRLLRRAILNVKKDLNGISEKHISTTIDMFNIGLTGKEIHIVDNIVSKVSYNDLIIERSTEEIEDYIYSYDLEEELLLGKLGYFITSRIMSIEEYNTSDKNRNSRYFDLDKLGRLSIRNRRNGDRFRPIGMKGRKKLKDYFIDEKISLDNRKKIPIILSDDEIIWIVGYRMSEDYKVIENTKKVLEINYKIK